jgi:CheY-like chemotaxis protein
MNVDILKTRLAVHGYELLTATDGAEALAIASAHHPDLILLDVRLCAEALGGQILISQRVYAVLEELLEAEPLGDLSLKGFLQSVPVFNVRALKEQGA